MGGVAKVCRPASWPGPSPSKKPVNCLSDASFTPGNMRLKRHLEKKVFRRRSNINKDKEMKTADRVNKKCWEEEGSETNWSRNKNHSYAPGLGSSASGSRLGCRVNRDLNSMAKPVSTLLWTGSLMTFFFFSSSDELQERTEEKRMNETVWLSCWVGFGASTGADPLDWAGRRSDSSCPVQPSPSSSPRSSSAASCRHRRRRFFPTSKSPLRRSRTWWEELRRSTLPCRRKQVQKNLLVSQTGRVTTHLSISWGGGAWQDMSITGDVGGVNTSTSQLPRAEPVRFQSHFIGQSLTLKSQAPPPPPAPPPPIRSSGASLRLMLLLPLPLLPVSPLTPRPSPLTEPPRVPPYCLSQSEHRTAGMQTETCRATMTGVRNIKRWWCTNKVCSIDVKK